MSAPIPAEIRILIVEDDPNMRNGTVHLLQKAGYACGTAANGLEALQILPSFRPHLVLTDRDMPEMDGIELCRYLKTGPEFAELFVVLISGRYTLSEEQTAGLEAGADGYITRPISNPELVARMAAFSRILRLNHDLREETLTRKKGQEALQQAHDELERKVAERTAALRASEENFRAMFEAASVGLAQAEIGAGKFLRVNPKMCAITGYAEAELLQMHISELTHPEDRQLDGELFQRVVRGELPAYQLEKRYVRKDGRIAWVNVNMTIVRGLTGQPVRTVAIVEDITERMRAQEGRRESEEHFRLALENTPIVVFNQDQELRYTWVYNPHPKFDPLTVLGRTDAELMSADDAAHLTQIKRRVLATGEKTRAEVKNTIGGQVFYYDLVVEALRDAGGKLVGVTGVTMEITERKQAEEVHAWLATAVEQSGESVVITDLQGTIRYVNPAFEAASGYSRTEVLGQNTRVLKSGQHDALFYRQMWATLTSGQVWRGRLVNRRKDGALYEEEGTISPIRDSLGKVINYVAVKHDVTREAKLEAQLRQAQKMEAVGTLASGIAHDLNNLLSPMLMVAGLLQDKLADEEDKRMLSLLQQEAKRGGDIVRQLLIYGRGIEGERMLVQPRYALREFFQLVRETFPRDIEIRQNNPRNVWPIFADQTQFHQLLMNLCVNARDAMPQGGILTVGLSNLRLNAGDPVLPPFSRAGPYLLIEVSDTGHGIPPEIRHRLFDPFFTTKPLGKGTGLGLSTVHGIAHKSGGFITVDSEPGRGSVFRVYWPAVPDEVVQVPAAPENATPAGHGELILVVDDEPSIRQATKILLERHGFRVALAENGEDALAKYHHCREDIKLVMTDIMMPVMSGIALIAALKELDPHLPIIAASGMGEINQSPELSLLGVKDIQMKPCPITVLLAAIHDRLAHPP